MKAARSGVAATAVLAVGAAFGLMPLAVDRACAADPSRDRAEDLAKAASQRFSEVMKGGPPGEPQSKPPAGE